MTVLHPRSAHPTEVGRDCVVGHLAHLEGVLIEEAVLIGSCSLVLDEACVRTGGIVAAGAVVLAGTEVTWGRRAQGVPADLVACDVYLETNWCRCPELPRPRPAVPRPAHGDHRDQVNDAATSTSDWSKVRISLTGASSIAR